VFRGLIGGLLIGAFVVGAQVAYRAYPDLFPALMLGTAVVLLFYRKLDRIEAALSEERRRNDFRRRQAGAGPRVLALLTAAVLCAAGSYAIWKWLPAFD
jgi:hypothetical protein